jgi:hypothetical protein
MHEPLSGSAIARGPAASRVDALAALACFHGMCIFTAQDRVILEYVDPVVGQIRRADIGVKELPSFFPGVRIFKRVPQRKCGAVSEAGLALLREFALTRTTTSHVVQIRLSRLFFSHRCFVALFGGFTWFNPKVEFSLFRALLVTTSFPVMT